MCRSVVFPSPSDRPLPRTPHSSPTTANCTPIIPTWPAAFFRRRLSRLLPAYPVLVPIVQTASATIGTAIPATACHTIICASSYLQFRTSFSGEQRRGTLLTVPNCKARWVTSIPTRPHVPIDSQTRAAWTQIQSTRSTLHLLLRDVPFIMPEEGFA